MTANGSSTMLQNYNTARNALELLYEHINYLEPFEKKYGREQRLRERLQDDNDVLMNELEELKARINKNNYVMVLVDGDGMTFTDGILKAENGVEKAATQLLTGVKEAVKQFYGKDEGSSEWKIKVKIYANIAGLHRTFVKAAITESFDRFSVNFNQQHPMLEFIDVGEGKEKADTKIREHLHWHLENYNCRAVFLAASHDSGYAGDLNRIVSNSLGNKLILVEGPRFAPQLGSERFKNLRWPETFRDHKVEAFPQMSNSQFSTLQYTHSFKLQSSSPTLQQLSPKLTNRPTPVSFASAATAGATAPEQVYDLTKDLNRSIKYDTPSHAAKKTKIDRTQQDFGERPPPPIFDEIKRLKPAPCNDYHLRDKYCPRGESCYMGHAYKNFKLRPEHLVAMRIRARRKRCTYGLNCTNPECYCGHACPHPLNAEKNDCSRDEHCQFDLSEHDLKVEWPNLPPK